MDDGLLALSGPAHVHWVSDVTDDQAKAGVFQGQDGRPVQPEVQYGHLVSGGQQPRHQGAPDVTCSTCHEDPVEQSRPHHPNCSNPVEQGSPEGQYRR